MTFRPGQVAYSERITTTVDRALKDASAVDIAGAGVILGFRVTGAARVVLNSQSDGGGEVLEDVVPGALAQEHHEYPVDQYRAYTDGIGITITGTVTAVRILYRPDPV